MADATRLADEEQAAAERDARVTGEVARPPGMLGAATTAIGAQMIQRKLSRRRAEGAIQRKVSESWGGKGLNAGAHTIGPNGERDPATGGAERLPLDGLPAADFPLGKAI